MIGCPYSVRRLANAVKFCLVPTLFLIILGAFPAALSLDNLSLLGVSPAFAGDDSEDDGHDEADSDGMICNNDDSVLNVGLLKFAKSSESSKKSNFFDPHIKATYRTYGWIPFTGEYFVIQDEDTDLRHAECGWLIAMRFCARYAVGEGGTLGDGTLVEESDHGYEPGDVNDAEGTCVSPYRARIIDGEEAAADPDNDPYDPEYDPYYIEPGRLCVYEDSMDGMDTDPDENFFHKQVPNEPPMAEYVERYAGIGARTGGFKDKVMPVLVIFVSPIIGLLAALIMSTYNHVVMLFTTGSSLGCVDVPLAPKPPIFFYQLSPPPPWPQVYPVHNDEEKWTEYVATQPSVYLATVNDPRHQDYWRHHENKDWFYPKIGIMLGETSFKFDSGNRIIDASETDRTRVTAILTGDFYGEDGPSSWGRDEAGYGRADSLPDLDKDNPDGSRMQIRKIDGKGSGDQLRIETEDGWVGYDLTTEVYNDEVCAYIVDTTWEFRDTDGDDPSLDEEPELIGCVKRPQTYIGRDGVERAAPPMPQVYHPWHDQNFSGIEGDVNAVSNFEHVYVWEWLRDDPRHPATFPSTAYANYDAYNTKDVDEDMAKAKKAFDFALELGMISTRHTSANSVALGDPVMVLVPKLGCDSIPSDGSGTIPEDYVYGDDVADIKDEDYFARKKNRRARIHGMVYCMNNFDTDGNGIIAGGETDMCAQGIDLTSIGQTLQIIKTPKVSDHYEPVTFPSSVTVKIPTLPYTSLEPSADTLNVMDFEGTEVNLPANTDINTLSGDSFIIGSRILSNNINLGCSKELGEIVITSEGEGEDEIVTETQEILSTNTVACNQMGGKYFRDAPDPFRGEVLVDKGNGTFRLMRRVDRDGNPPNKLIRISPHKLYLTSVPTSGGGTIDLDLPIPVEGECPIALMSDKITFRHQLNDTNVCLLNADGSPDETTVAVGGLINTPIADRRYYSPDQYRGESLMVQSTLEQGLNNGYCVTMPPSMCPTINGDDGVDYWPAGNALPFCDPDETSLGCPIEELNNGVAEGVCKTGFGARPTICDSASPCYRDVSSIVKATNPPTRRCAGETSLFDAEGEWGDIIADCEPLECPAMTTNYTDSGPDPDVTYRCDWAATEASSDDGDSWAGAIHSSHPSDSHSGTKCGGSPGNTHESRRKRCNENGEWATNSCSWNQNADDLNNSSCSDSRNDTVVP